MAERHWQQKEQLKKENRRVLEWSGDEDDNMDNQAKSETHDKILGGLSVDEPWKQMESLPISPSGVKMQFPTKSDKNSNNANLAHNEGIRSIHVNSQQDGNN